MLYILWVILKLNFLPLGDNSNSAALFNFIKTEGQNPLSANPSGK